MPDLTDKFAMATLLTEDPLFLTSMGFKVSDKFFKLRTSYEDKRKFRSKTI